MPRKKTLCGWGAMLSVAALPFVLPTAVLAFAVTWLGLAPFLGAKGWREAPVFASLLSMACVLWLWQFMIYALLTYAWEQGL